MNKKIPPKSPTPSKSTHPVTPPKPAKPPKAASDFNELFNILHGHLTTLLDSSEKRDFYSCILEIRNRSEHSPLFAKISDKYEDDLKTLNSVRNIFIHKNDWIQVTPNTIKILQEVITAIANISNNFHKKAIDIFGKKIYSARDTDTLAAVIEAMGSRNFTHVPIYTEAGKFRGVFSLKSLVIWMNSQRYLIDKNITISEMTIDTKQSEYLFIASSTPVSNVDAYFRDYSVRRRKLGAIFLTASGTPADPIQGIITAWDIPMIYEQLQI